MINLMGLLDYSYIIGNVKATILTNVKSSVSQIILSYPNRDRD